ncbi:MAG: dihydrolipoyl dehydrogenase [Candidatus Omnitrophica bacterium]|nr:dihydrolipoyl dehydrogenase [Candidatus Omnitrophota bacterium]MDE2010394.1 dihydrolipoyl dehydrogenase [Candidatus Omnitrophota bacterium]MDE2214780.1 dihydrolipoyl dehydrogenase [Candidatus Omnitrophota bacterium]MDE2231437.1 dihydrolipoyl dehydrogenase [Candidatus Omnitrophota bacterium]
MSAFVQLVVIGAGPGGYAAAFLAADLGLSVAIVEKETNPGGVCLYRGCIPSKAFLHAAKIISEANHARAFGIEYNEPRIDIAKLRDWKKSVVTKLTGGLGSLARARKIKYIQGEASFLNSNTLKVKKSDGTNEELAFQKAILATGSRPAVIPNLPQSPDIWDSTAALNMEVIPENLLIVGGGYIGMELGTVYRELGSKVSVVEMTPGLLPGADRDLADVLSRRVKNLFAKIMLETKVVKMEAVSNGIAVTFAGKDGKEFKENYNKVLVSIGRKPNSENLGLENTKVKVTPRGFVEVNDQRRTTDPNIYAIGDIAGDPMLAHKATHEGRVAAEAIAGHKVAFGPQAIPAVVFTDPEIAWCGLTELDAAKAGREITVAKFPWGASGRALTLDRQDGLTKLVIDPKTQRVLGVGIVGVNAGEMIAEGVLAIEMGALAKDLELTIHPHPTLSETNMGAAEIFFGNSTDIFKPKKS